MLEPLLAEIPPSCCGCAAYAPAAERPPYVAALVAVLRVKYHPSRSQRRADPCWIKGAGKKEVGKCGV